MQTISCLLIHPNPDSALNSAAGALLQDDYDAFAKQARLMTSIHAPIPPSLKDAVLEAKRTGEERESGPHCEAAARPTASRASSIATSAVRKNQDESNTRDAGQENDNNALLSSLGFSDVPGDHGEDDDAKENDPSHSPSLALLNHEGSRRNVLGKRPLSELPTPINPDSIDSNIPVEDHSATCIGEKVPPSQPPAADDEPSSEPLKKSPKLDISARSLNTYGRVRQEDCSKPAKAEHSMASTATDLGDDKENMQIHQMPTASDNTKATAQQTGCQTFEHPQRPTLRKVSNVGSSRLKGQARVGIRRL
jgi:ubiquitin-conjugating enzyme E2 S